MAKGVARGWRDDSGGQNSPPYCFLNQGGIEMVAALLSCHSVVPAPLLREHPLPAPFHWCVGVFPPQGIGKAHSSIPLGKVLAMQATDLFQVGLPEEGQNACAAVDLSSYRRYNVHRSA